VSQYAGPIPGDFNVLGSARLPSPLVVAHRPVLAPAHVADDQAVVLRPVAELGRKTVGQIVHVMRNTGGGWCVQIDGDERPSSEHRSQLEAITEGRRLAKAEKTRLFIHAKDGQVRDRMTYDGTLPRSYARW
jgi:hypothetical protein